VAVRKAAAKGGKAKAVVAKEPKKAEAEKQVQR
jgi:hypothetical protein